MFFSRPAGHKFVNRGDPDSYDYDANDFIIDGMWHDLDISSIIPKNAKLVLLRIRFKAIETSKFFEFRTNNQVYINNIVSLYTTVTNIFVCGDVFVTPDSNGIIDYCITTNTTATINVCIAGWFV